MNVHVARCPIHDDVIIMRDLKGTPCLWGRVYRIHLILATFRHTPQSDLVPESC